MDAVALAYHAESDKTFAINGSGRSPQAATVEAIHVMDHDHIDPLAITVPGAAHATRYPSASAVSVLEEP